MNQKESPHISKVLKIFNLDVALLVSQKDQMRFNNKPNRSILMTFMEILGQVPQEKNINLLPKTKSIRNPIMLKNKVRAMGRPRKREI